jgi:hypothetical protein
LRGVVGGYWLEILFYLLVDGLKGSIFKPFQPTKKKLLDEFVFLYYFTGFALD